MYKFKGISKNSPPVIFSKFFCIAIFAALCASYTSADTASFEGSACTVGVEYNSKAEPGDAIVVRMTLRGKERKRAVKDTVAQAELRTETKKIDSAQFFYINQKAKRQSVQEFLAYVPISIWVSNGAYAIKVVYSAFGADAEEFTLPITVIKKDFNSETIALDARNTGIRTNTSPERIAQSEKLNALLETVILSDVYTIKPFVPPVAADTRRTSLFGDRRVYRYTDGKSAASAHYGIDYGVPEGTSIAACADGKVVMAENRITTGYSVVIAHAPGLYSLYYHLSALNVKEGQSVKQGDVLGLSGKTGLATGPHLHWEVRLNMCAVSPDFFTGDYAYTKQQ